MRGIDTVYTSVMMCFFARFVLLVGALLVLNRCTTPGSMRSVTPDATSYYERFTYRNYHKAQLFHELLDFNSLDYPRLHAAICFATNTARVRHDRAALTYHPLLERAASRYAQRLVAQNFFAHEDPFDADLRTVEQRVQDVGVENPEPTENLAIYYGIRYRSGQPFYRLKGRKGSFSWTPGGPPIPNHTYLSFAEAVVDFWLNSPPHRANLLAPEGRQVGCGAAFYWGTQGLPRFKTVQVFQWFEPAKP